MMISATKFCLAVCHRFGQRRLAVGKSGKSDTPIIEFNLFQVTPLKKNALYPLLAKTVCYNLALNEIKDIYVASIDKEANQEIITLCCSIKPLITWNARNVVT